MMTKTFDQALEILQSEDAPKHGVGQQAHSLLLCHAQAGLGRKDEARQQIAALRDVKHPRIYVLKEALIRRYGLNGEGQLTSEETARLDDAISEEEVYFALAA